MPTPLVSSALKPSLLPPSQSGFNESPHEIRTVTVDSFGRPRVNADGSAIRVPGATYGSSEGYLWVSFEKDEGASLYQAKSLSRRNKVLVDFQQTYAIKTQHRHNRMSKHLKVLGEGESYWDEDINTTVYVCSIGADTAKVVVAKGDGATASAKCATPASPPQPPASPPPPLAPCTDVSSTLSDFIYGGKQPSGWTYNRHS
jgi:hypothetical protein